MWFIVRTSHVRPAVVTDLELENSHIYASKLGSWAFSGKDETYNYCESAQTIEQVLKLWMLKIKEKI